MIQFQKNLLNFKVKLITNFLSKINQDISIKPLKIQQLQDLLKI